MRVSLPHRLSGYTTIGRSSRSSDRSPSWNQMYGLVATDLLGSGVRADARLSRFDSPFGRGWYQTIMLSRELSEHLRIELKGGQQDIRSGLSNNNRARFLTSYFDWFLGTHFVLGGGYTLYRGDQQNYDQASANLGYRF